MNAPRSLDEVLEAAVQVNATAVTLEPEPGGLEVAFLHGSSGVGLLVTDPAHQHAILSELAQRARLGTRVSRNVEFTIGSAVHKVSVSSREHFLETAFDLCFSPDPPTRHRRGLKKRP
jgi:hypothetical protein